MSEQGIKIENTLGEEPTGSFMIKVGESEALRFDPDGSIYVRGEQIDDNREVYRSVLEVFGLTPTRRRTETRAFKFTPDEIGAHWFRVNFEENTYMVTAPSGKEFKLDLMQQIEFDPSDRSRCASVEGCADGLKRRCALEPYHLGPCKMQSITGEVHGVGGEMLGTTKDDP